MNSGVLSKIDWQARRIIPSRFPPISLFERVIEPAEYDAAFYIESMTNDRLRDEVGDLSLVAPEDPISGQGASPVMAAFTHIGQPSRFTDGSYGVYYAANDSKTAIAETAYHSAIFLSATNEPDTCIYMREYVGNVVIPVMDITPSNFDYLHHPDDYSASQSFGRLQRNNNLSGLLYNSVRRNGGLCIAAFKPTTMSPVVQSAHYEYTYSASMRSIRHVLHVSEVTGI